jgi:hypothetical protein
MELVRTTIRIKKNLKREAEKLAHDKETSFQEVVNDALLVYLTTQPRKVQKIEFITHDFGDAFDNLKRSDYYGEPHADR